MQIKITALMLIISFFTFAHGTPKELKDELRQIKSALRFGRYSKSQLAQQAKELRDRAQEENNLSIRKQASILYLQLIKK